MERLLTLEETKMCLIAYREHNDEDALNLLIKCNMRLVRYFANICLSKCLNLYLNKSYTFEDFESYGMEALFKAIKYFDYQKYDIAAFSTYIANAIIREMNREIQNNYKNFNVLSLNAPLVNDSDEDDALTLEDTLTAEEENDIVRDIDNNINAEIIKKVLEQLTPRERDIINLHFGFKGEFKSYSETARVFGCSSTAIMNQEKRALRKLRRNPELKKIR